MTSSNECEIDKAVIWYEGGLTYHLDKMIEGKLYKGLAWDTVIGIMKKGEEIHTYEWSPDEK